MAWPSSAQRVAKRMALHTGVTDRRVARAAWVGDFDRNALISFRVAPFPRQISPEFPDAGSQEWNRRLLQTYDTEKQFALSEAEVLYSLHRCDI